MRDQAERLRKLAETYKAEIIGPRPSTAARRARVLAITSGKGGVGKTNLSVNLSYALISLGKEVCLLDADLGLANVDVLLGTVPRLHMGHAVSGEADIVDLIYEAPGNLKLIAGGSGISELADLPEADLQRFVRSLRHLETQTDFLVLDTGAGLGRAVTNFVLAADLVVVVTTPEPTAVTDAYAVIKAVVKKNPAADLKLVVNNAQDNVEGEEAADRLRTTVLRFLGASLDFLGAIPADKEVLRSVRSQRPFFLSAPSSPASQAVREIAIKLIGESQSERSGVGLFFDRLSRIFLKRR